MIGYVYFPATGALPTSSDTALKIGTSAGTVIGQLGFGFMADHLGRKKVPNACYRGPKLISDVRH
jgi:PHS family inorganic phosphate transporter-like MFS transporter